MVHVPATSKLTVAPETVQTDVVCELKTTESPEDAVALTANDGDPYAWLCSGPKVIVWLP